MRTIAVVLSLTLLVVAFDPGVRTARAEEDPEELARAFFHVGALTTGVVDYIKGRMGVVSPDMVTWTALDVPPIQSSDEWSLSFDPKDRLFIATPKLPGPGGSRAVGLSVSKDFVTWSKPELVFQADDVDQERGRTVLAGQRNPRIVEELVSDDQLAWEPSDPARGQRARQLVGARGVGHVGVVDSHVDHSGAPASCSRRRDAS